jgi:xanthine dehydrogenase accessory factor
MPRHAGSKMVVYSDGRIVGTVGGGAMEALVIQAAQQALLSGQASLSSYRLNDLSDGDPGVCGGTAEIFVEAILARPTMVVIGCGHTGKALAELAKWLDFRVIVSDDRAEFCNPTAIPDMDGYVVAPSAEIAEKLPLGPHTYVAAVTRGMPVDLELFPALLAADLPYLGVIGSRRRWALTIKELEARGITRDRLARVHAPIGLELNAETPQEIAVSIMAEIIMIRRGGTGVPMQWIGPAED